jgi:hypothetical protein
MSSDKTHSPTDKTHSPTDCLFGKGCMKLTCVLCNEFIRNKAKRICKADERAEYKINPTVSTTVKCPMSDRCQGYNCVYCIDAQLALAKKQANDKKLLEERAKFIANKKHHDKKFEDETKCYMESKTQTKCPHGSIGRCQNCND